jgi:hypothetical protein
VTINVYEWANISITRMMGSNRHLQFTQWSFGVNMTHNLRMSLGALGNVGPPCMLCIYTIRLSRKNISFRNKKP